jgi:hypothetical protein
VANLGLCGFILHVFHRGFYVYNFHRFGSVVTMTMFCEGQFPGSAGMIQLFNMGLLFQRLMLARSCIATCRLPLPSSHKALI